MTKPGVQETEGLEPSVQPGIIDERDHPPHTGGRGRSPTRTRAAPIVTEGNTELSEGRDILSRVGVRVRVRVRVLLGYRIYRVTPGRGIVGFGSRHELRSDLARR